MSKLFYVTNGWQADLPMSVLVIADDADRAVVLARPSFIEEYERWPRILRDKMRLSDLLSFHTLETTELCHDTAIEWASPMGEGIYESD